MKRWTHSGVILTITALTLLWTVSFSQATIFEPATVQKMIDGSGLIAVVEVTDIDVQTAPTEKGTTDVTMVPQNVLAGTPPAEQFTYTLPEGQIPEEGFIETEDRSSPTRIATMARSTTAPTVRFARRRHSPFRRRKSSPA